MEKLEVTLPENCGGIKYKKVKKGEVIGKMGYATNKNYCLQIGSKNQISAGIYGVTQFSF